jgi:hypothetical protein
VRTIIAGFTITAVIAVCFGSMAWAAPTQVDVRIEGSSETLFEGPIWTEGHDIEASSDIQQRPCDGINPNDPENTVPGPTPTAAAADALSLIGGSFDGRWYPGYDDYFITRWGPDKEEAGMSWGVLVNNVFTDVGGCQYELGRSDEVLWVFDAFEHRPLLALFAAEQPYASGTRPLTATAKLGKPFEVEVLGYDESTEDVPPAAPQRIGSSPYEGAEVSPVQTSATGVERVLTVSPETVTTDAEGKASITFTESGWHRLKATQVNAKGEESAIRSNRLDVCVPPEGSTTCQDPFPEDQVRTPPRYAQQAEEEGGGAGASNGPSNNGGTSESSLIPSSPAISGQARPRSSARLRIVALSTARLLLKFGATGRATVRIDRPLGTGHRRFWQTVRRISVYASRAGYVRVKLPRLTAGRYRLSVAFAGGKSLVRSLTVARR